MTIEARDYQGMDDQQRDAEQLCMAALKQATQALKYIIEHSEYAADAANAMLEIAPKLSSWEDWLAEKRRAE
jgi:hypothetical protein